MRGEERRFDVKIEGSDAWIHVRMRRDVEKGFDWAAVLTVERDGGLVPVCVYDNAHGQPERHRIRDGIKGSPEPQPSRGSARFDLPATIAEIKADWEGMVERWL